jgi:hypothetical protein
MSNKTLTPQEMYRQLRSLGFSAEQALAEMDGASDASYDNEPVEIQPVARRQIAVSMPVARRRVSRGPRMEYAAKPVPKGRKVVVSMGNNTDVYKFLTSLRGRKATVPMIAKATGISLHSVESSVYRLVTDGLIAKSAIEGR